MCLNYLALYAIVSDLMGKGSMPLELFHFKCHYGLLTKYGTITKTCPCNVYPLEPHFYIEKLGYAGVYLFFLFLLLNIDCGYSLEPPRLLTCTHNLCFEQN